MHQPILARALFTFISIPLILLALAEFKGPAIGDAFEHTKETLTTFPHMTVVILYLSLFSILMIRYIHPMLNVWKNQANGRISSQEERDKAMHRMNNIDRVVTIFCVIGFSLGRINELIIAARLYRDTARDIFMLGFLQAWSIGLFSAVLINLTLSNILFPVRRAILLQGSSISLRKYSYIKKIFLAFFSLFFFLLMQMAVTSFDLLQVGGQFLKNTQEIPGTNHALWEWTRRIRDTNPGRFLNNEAIKRSFSVLVLRAFFCFLLALRMLSLLKKELKNPLNTVASKLNLLASHNGGETGLIDIVTNDEFAPIFRSINELIARQGEQVQSSRDRLEKIIEHAADPIISFHREGTIIIFNPAAERYFGIPKQQAQSMLLRNLFTQDEIETCGCGEDDIAFIEYLTSNQNRLRRFSGRGRNRVVHFEANISSTQTSEGPVYTAILRDISAQMEFEETLTKAKVAAETANRMKSEFLANMSHELRTPLNAVLGFTQLLIGDETLSDAHKEKIRIISRSGEHLLGLINDILDISKIEAGKAELNTSVCNIHQFLEEIYEMFTMRCEKKGLNLDMEILDTLPRHVALDTGKLRQIIINLVGNAVKFTDEGGITILAGVENGMIKIEVADTGRGIDAEDIERIVDPFVQSTANANEGGTGLGLAISNSYIHMMGGELSIRSEPGKGSVFSFTITLNETGAPPEQTEQSAGILSVSDGKSPLVLIVDDKEHNRTILRQMLEKSGFTVEEAADGEESVRMNRALRPELIFMDIRMPVMDGYEAVAQIRNEKNSHTPVIFALTASAFKQDEQKILQSGFDGYLAKPFKIAALYRLIEQKTGITFAGEKSPGEPGTIPSREPDYEQAADIFTSDMCKTLIDALEINDFGTIRTIAESVRKEDGSGTAEALLQAAAQFDEVKTRLIITSISQAGSNRNAE